MRNELEHGLKSFIELALEAASMPPITVRAASGATKIPEAEPTIVCSVPDAPHVVGTLGHANALVWLVSPHTDDYEPKHRQFNRFLRDVLAPPIPPNLGPNAAHISQCILAATDGEYSSRGYHLEGYDSEITNDRQISEIKLLIGICRYDPSPLLPDGPVILTPAN